MVEYYNLSFMDTNNTMIEFVQSVNTLSHGWLTGLILFTLFIILLIAMKQYYTKVGFIVASYITTIVAILFLFLNMTSMGVVLLFVIGSVGSTIYYYFSEE